MPFIELEATIGKKNYEWLADGYKKLDFTFGTYNLRSWVGINMSINNMSYKEEYDHWWQYMGSEVWEEAREK